jgi:hypothetical protein
MKNYNDTIGNRTRVLPTCSAMPQLTASPRIPKSPAPGMHLPSTPVLMYAKIAYLLRMAQRRLTLVATVRHQGDFASEKHKFKTP